MKLYHYTSLKKFSSIWESMELWLSSAQVQSNNDIFEKYKPVSIDTSNLDFVEDTLMGKGRIKINKYLNSLHLYRQASFAKDYKNKETGEFITYGCLSPMMWGQYADCANGVCLEFDSEHLKFNDDTAIIHADEVEYDENVSSFIIDEEKMKTISDPISFIEQHIKELYYHKHIHWYYENEYRVVSRVNSKDDILSIMIEDSLTHIYVPRYQGESSDFVKTHVGNKFPISFLTTEEENGVKKLCTRSFNF